MHARTYAPMQPHTNAPTLPRTHAHMHLRTPVSRLQLCEAKTKALLEFITPMVDNEAGLEGVIRQIMEADQKIYNAGREDRLRQKMWEDEFPPLPIHKRHLGTRKNGTQAYAWDIKLEEVIMQPHHLPLSYNLA